MFIQAYRINNGEQGLFVNVTEENKLLPKLIPKSFALPFGQKKKGVIQPDLTANNAFAAC